MCENRSQIVSVQAGSTGFIQSPGYPNSSSETDGPCTVNLVVNDPVSVKIKVNGMFEIQPTVAPNCCDYNRQFWINDRNMKGNNFCGLFDDGTELCTVENSAVVGDTTISLGFIYNTYGNPNMIVYFRIMYTGNHSYYI